MATILRLRPGQAPRSCRTGCSSRRPTNGEAVKEGKRYDTSKMPEAQFEPGSRGRVLKNLLGIRRKGEVDEAEARAQSRALEELIGRYDVDHRFTAEDVSEIHRVWLGEIYPWAGRYRQVNISKGNFSFAASAHIATLMKELENGPLKHYTPCLFKSHDEIAHALAVVHTELMLIHPFREGNGRTGRILAILMALQAGLPILDFGGIAGKRRQEYFAAVRAGLDRNYAPMERIFRLVISRTLRISESDRL